MRMTALRANLLMELLCLLEQLAIYQCMNRHPVKLNMESLALISTSLKQIRHREEHPSHAIVGGNVLVLLNLRIYRQALYQYGRLPIKI